MTLSVQAKRNWDCPLLRSLQLVVAIEESLKHFSSLLCSYDGFKQEAQLWRSGLLQLDIANISLHSLCQATENHHP